MSEEIKTTEETQLSEHELDNIAGGAPWPTKPTVIVPPTPGDKGVIAHYPYDPTHIKT